MTRQLWLLVFLSALCCSLGEEVALRRNRRGTRRFNELCADSGTGETHSPGETWLRWQGQRVEFCGCTRGTARCHTVPVVTCYLPRCYNGGTCKEAVYSSDFICQCLPGFTGPQCEINTTEKCIMGRGTSYRGTWSVSMSGRDCVNWNSSALAQKKYTAKRPDSTMLGLGNHNYCRNPDNDTKPWCHVYRGVQLTWEYCSLPSCPTGAGAECVRGVGQSYRGTQAVTKSGSRCLKWDSPAVARKTYNAWRGNSKELGLGSHNYCRNPDSDKSPWCHVYRGSQLTWEHCDIPQCVEKRPVPITTLGPRAPTSGGSSRESCGMRAPARPQFRIKGGEMTDITAHPWQAAITVYRPRSRVHTFLCGGVLIGSCWVLSAAHCFQEKYTADRLQVVLGRTFRLQNSSSDQIFSVEQYWVHERYDDETYDNDIVLLKLRGEGGMCAIQTPSVRPVCLPEPDLALPDMTECEISGYGKNEEFSPFYSEQLKQGRVRLWPFRSCTSDRLSGRLVTENMLCAGDTRNLDDACKGDSGGPLVCAHAGRQTLLGVISWGDGCGKKDTPGVYTRVTRYIPWITARTRSATH
ncbi:tissue-type plasminogen activator isoform X1 [Lepisosteus oculatus]|uniref:tissue-type plasminogen activator isoform X1 n=1 Tax=Lepisosteus oculatus TaxID=7918 RepID=UPI0035F52C8A